MQLVIGAGFFHVIDNQLESGKFARFQFESERSNRPVIDLVRIPQRMLYLLYREVVAPRESCPIVDGAIWRTTA